MQTQTFDTVVIGGGQAGLSAAHHLRRAGRSFVVLDANERIGDAWRHRYDSLRLFTTARYTGLPGGRFPGSGAAMPTKDEMADYLEAYASRFDLPVRSGMRVESVRREGDRYLVRAGDAVFEADDVIVASGAHGEPRVPSIASDLRPDTVQLHSSAYRNPSQLRDGGVLVVGAGNFGGDIALELARTHPTWVSGPIRGAIPFDVDTWIARNVAVRIVRFVGLHVLTLRTPMGRKAAVRFASQGAPLVRVKPKWLTAAGVELVSKTVGTRDGLPMLEDGRVLDVANVIWCTGYRHDLSWLELPILGDDGTVRHERGVVQSEPGLYFVGLPFQYSAGSDTLPGVGRDAAFVVRRLVGRTRSRAPMPAPA
jgi:putative flavoprotein involved in K+ transport